MSAIFVVRVGIVNGRSVAKGFGVVAAAIAFAAHVAILCVRFHNAGQTIAVVAMTTVCRHIDSKFVANRTNGVDALDLKTVGSLATLALAVQHLIVLVGVRVVVEFTRMDQAGLRLAAQLVLVDLALDQFLDSAQRDPPENLLDNDWVEQRKCDQPQMIVDKIWHLAHQKNLVVCHSDCCRCCIQSFFCGLSQVATGGWLFRTFLREQRHFKFIIIHRKM